MDVSSALSVSWPVILVCLIAIGALAWSMKSSAAALRASLDQLAGAQAQLNGKIADVDQQLKQVGSGHTELLERIASCERSVQQAAGGTSSGKTTADDGGVVEVSAESMQRFDAASQALTQLAQELGGFDARQAENWQRIKGDLEEQSFHLQRVQQHVDRLFAGAAVPVAEHQV